MEDDIYFHADYKKVTSTIIMEFIHLLDSQIMFR